MAVARRTLNQTRRRRQYGMGRAWAAQDHIIADGVLKGQGPEQVTKPQESEQPADTSSTSAVIHS